jgi:isopropylmalate/homocitrate/citramalate synthase
LSITNNLSFSPLSASCDLIFFSLPYRSNREFLYRILEEVIKAGATTVSILDSVEYTYRPDEFENFIAGIKEKTHGIENAIVSTHCQSGPRFATAYTLAVLPFPYLFII